MNTTVHFSEKLMEKAKKMDKEKEAIKHLRESKASWKKETLKEREEDDRQGSKLVQYHYDATISYVRTKASFECIVEHGDLQLVFVISITAGLPKFKNQLPYTDVQLWFTADSKVAVKIDDKFYDKESTNYYLVVPQKDKPNS